MRQCSDTRYWDRDVANVLGAAAIVVVNCKSTGGSEQQYEQTRQQ
jgi:hypothetical protein